MAPAIVLSLRQYPPGGAITHGMTPIPTTYAGVQFRSRLEARWAVFFDQLKIRWLFEPEGFELPSGARYLPDFYLPDLKIWAEIKPRDVWLEDARLREFACQLPASRRHRDGYPDPDWLNSDSPVFCLLWPEPWHIESTGAYMLLERARICNREDLWSHTLEQSAHFANAYRFW